MDYHTSYDPIEEENNRNKDKVMNYKQNYEELCMQFLELIDEENITDKEEFTRLVNYLHKSLILVHEAYLDSLQIEQQYSKEH